jgi:hypothetical protein
MFSRKSNPAFDLDHELLVVLDKAREAGLSSRTISSAFQARADAERQRDAMTRPHSGAIGTVYYDPMTNRPIVK